MITHRRAFALAAAVALLREPDVASAQSGIASLDAIAIITDDALDRATQSLLPLHFTVDQIPVDLNAVTLCPASSEHEVDLVALGAPAGSTIQPIPGSACTSSLAQVASAAVGALPPAPATWRAAARIHLTWSDDSLRATITDSAVAASPAGASPPAGAAASSAPGVLDASHLRATLGSAPLFALDTRRLVALDFAGHDISLVAVPKFEAHRAVVELMRDPAAASNTSAWSAFENDASAAVPNGSDAVVAGSQSFVASELATVFATPVVVYRAQDHVVTVHDVRIVGAADDVHVSGEAADNVTGASGLVTGEYAGASDLLLRAINVAPHLRTCGFMDLVCVGNNVTYQVGSTVLARQLFSRYGNQPLRPSQPIAFPLTLQGRTLTLTVQATQVRSSADDIRLAGRLSVSS